MGENLKKNDHFPNDHIKVFSYVSTAPRGLGLLIVEVSISHSVRHITVGRTPLDE
jgi:hypothetical protein